MQKLINVEVSSFQDSRLIKVASLSAVCNGNLYPSKELRVFLVLISVVGSVDPRALVRPEGLSQ